MNFSVNGREFFTATGALIGAFCGEPISLTSVANSLAGAILTNVTFSVGTAILRNKDNPYRYAALAHKELMVVGD